MKSITYGDVTFEGMCRLIRNYLGSDRGMQYKITVGTDSQNFNMTKVVIVVAVCRVGKGGIFFYDIRNVKRITNIRQKIFFETSLSLEMAGKLSAALARESFECDIDIHVDAGNKGPSSGLIAELAGWISAYGFECITKPESYAASSIANRYSK